LFSAKFFSSSWKGPLEKILVEILFSPLFQRFFLYMGQKKALLFPFTTSLNEALQANPRQYPVSYFFNYFEAQKIVDTEPLRLIPNLRNFKNAKEVVSKWLDRFLVFENLAGRWFLLHTSMEMGGHLNHLPILLNLDKEDQKPMTPMKLIHTWLLEPNYKKLVEDNWVPLNFSSTYPCMQKLADNLSKVKLVTKT